MHLYAAYAGELHSLLTQNRGRSATANFVLIFAMHSMCAYVYSNIHASELRSSLTQLKIDVKLSKIIF